MAALCAPHGESRWDNGSPHAPCCGRMRKRSRYVVAEAGWNADSGERPAHEIGVPVLILKSIYKVQIRLDESITR
jgi:hypothetical protein